MNTHATSKLAKICALTVIALILLCVVWESIGAPIHPLSEGFPWLAIKGVLLLPLVPRLWRVERRAFQILTLLILLYFTEGCVRAFSDINFASRAYAWGEIVLSLIIFVWANKVARALRTANAVARERKPRPKGWTQLGMYLYAILLVLVGMSFVYTPDGTESTVFHQIVWLIRIGFVVFNLVLVVRLIQNGRAKAAQDQHSYIK
ncbi:MAG: hypothetical protein H6R05_1371 [Burkholderiaceae bacterium]|nr:hypothetical protein [Burkholderiaceae bacterium]